MERNRTADEPAVAKAMAGKLQMTQTNSAPIRFLPTLSALEFGTAIIPIAASNADKSMIDPAISLQMAKTP
jgi:hypothetical protein